MARQDVRTITKKELVDQIAERNGLSRTKAQVIVQDVLDTVINVLSDGHRLELRDFGVFEVKTLAPRTAQNPRTLERVPVPERRTVRFKAGKGMREKIEAGTRTSEPMPEPKAGVRGSSAGLAEHAAGEDRTAPRHQSEHHNGQPSR